MSVYLFTNVCAIVSWICSGRVHLISSAYSNFAKMHMQKGISIQVTEAQALSPTAVQGHFLPPVRTREREALMSVLIYTLVLLVC